MNAGVFQGIVHALRQLLREIAARAPHPRPTIFDSRILHPVPNVAIERATTEPSGGGGVRPTSRAVDTLGHLLALLVTPVNTQDRAQVAELAQQVQEATGEMVEIAFVDHGYTGDQAAADADARGIRLEVVKLPAAKRGFVLLPRRWVVERSFAWMVRFRRLARDYERLPDTLAGATSATHKTPFTSMLPVLKPPYSQKVWRQWGSEHGLHERRDMTLAADRARVRIGHGSHTLAVRNTTLLGLFTRQGQQNVPTAQRRFS